MHVRRTLGWAAALSAAALLLGAAPSGAARAARTTVVSVSSSEVSGNEVSYPAAVSADGRFVVFNSDASNLVRRDINGVGDVFVRDRRAGTTSRVSVNDAGQQANGPSTGFSISADGRFVAFHSWADNLVPADTNAWTDVFVRDRVAKTTTRVSVTTRGEQADGAVPSMSADGRFVAFHAWAPNLVAGDDNDQLDVFVHDRQTAVTSAVSVSSRGRPGNGESARPVISADGRVIAFESQATNLEPGDSNAHTDLFAHDRVTRTTARVSVPSSGEEANEGTFHGKAVSADGRYVAFGSMADNLVVGDTNEEPDVFVRDRQTGTTTRVNVSSTGEQAFSRPSVWTYATGISGDGRYVTFTSLAGNLAPGDSDNNSEDVFLRDRRSGTTSRVNASASGEYRSASGGLLSTDGRHVAFSSSSGLEPRDTNTWGDAYVRNLGAEAPPGGRSE